MSKLSDKLKSLGVQVGAQGLPPPRRPDRYPIEAVVDGLYLDTPFGQTFLVETRYALDHRQGLVGINLTSSLRTIANWAGNPLLMEIDLGGLAFLDTETSGLAGGTGTYVFLVGIGRFDHDSFRLTQFFMRDPLEELAHLAAVLGVLNACSGLVTFNGKAFDVPLLNTRYITNGEPPPLTTTAHLDLLLLARRLWRDRLPSRALGYLEEHILGARREEADVPGWMIPSMYFDYLRSGDARALKSVFYHNAMDVLSMAGLLNHVATLLEGPLAASEVNGIDLIAIAKLFESMGLLDNAVHCYSGGLTCDLPEETRREAVMRWALLEKRRGNLVVAAELWRQAAERNELYAFVELAKHAEHRLRDYAQALSWTEIAVDIVKAPSFPLYERRHWLPDLEHRRCRILEKLAST